MNNVGRSKVSRFSVLCEGIIYTTTRRHTKVTNEGRSLNASTILKGNKIQPALDLRGKKSVSLYGILSLPASLKGNQTAETMTRLLIYVGLIALFACTSKPGIEAPTTVTSLPESTINTSSGPDCTRVNSQAVRKIPKEQMLKRASDPKDQPDTRKTIPNALTIKAILKEFNTKPLQEHKITGLNNTTIRLQEGTIIKIPANAFITKKNAQEPKGKVRLMVKEYYSLSDILFANLTTTTI